MGQFLILLGVFLTSFFIAYGLTVGQVALRCRKVRLIAPVENALIRIRCREGVLRSYMIDPGRKGWVISCPIKGNSHVPMRHGELLVAESPVPGGVLMFSTQVIARDRVNHQLTIAVPTDLRRVERRVESRDLRFSGQPALLNGEKAVLIDLSPSGARVVAATNVCAGDHVMVELPSRLGVARGWVLSVVPDSLGSRQASQVRILFTDSIEEVQIEAAGCRLEKC